MRILDWVSAGSAAIERQIADSARNALYLRHMLRGNFPLRRRRVRHRDRHDAAAAGPPVLLVPGYLATRGSLHLLRERLGDLGHAALSYPVGMSHLGDIRRSAALLGRRIEALTTHTPGRRLDVVAHSMGGLVMLHYIKRLGGYRRVRKLVLLGTPAAGTWSALAGVLMAPLGRASLQLLPSSAFVRELRVGSLPRQVEIVAIAGERDLLAPKGRTVVAGVRHLALPTNHSGLLVDPEVAELVSAVLRADQPRTNAARFR
jgi:pimeloyl-ACP methyl ester carboxylesterase